MKIADVSSNTQLVPYIFQMPEDVMNIIIIKLRPNELICFLNTCTSSQKLKEKAWECLSKYHFHWICSPSLEISSNSNVTWRGIYQSLKLGSSALDWTSKSFKLEIPGSIKQAKQDNNGNLFVLSWENEYTASASKGNIHTWSLDGTKSEPIPFPVEVWSKIEDHSCGFPCFLPLNNAFYMKGYRDGQSYLWLNSKLHPLDKSFSGLAELDKNLFVTFEYLTDNITLFMLNESGNLETKQLKALSNILELHLLDNGEFITTHGKEVCLFTPNNKEWSQKKGVLNNGHVFTGLSDSMIVTTEPNQQEDNQINCNFGIWKMDTSKEEITFELVKSVKGDEELKARLRIVRLPNGNFVTHDKVNGRIVWPSNLEGNPKVLNKEKIVYCELFIRKDTWQIVAVDLQRKQCFVFTPSFKTSSSESDGNVNECKVS